jgi:hypothetical protein
MLKIEIEKTMWSSHRVDCIFCGAEFKHSFYVAVLHDSEWGSAGPFHASRGCLPQVSGRGDYKNIGDSERAGRVAVLAGKRDRRAGHIHMACI